MDMVHTLIGTSTVIRELEEDLLCAARSDAKVLLTGESGVGKEVVARRIHESSRRGSNPLVTINCAGVPDTLLESELFGHMRGSFTDANRDKRGLLELAHHGTVLLDEIGEMSLRMQALLLRFLETGEIQRVGSERSHTTIDARVISSTNRDLMQRVKSGEFREDLYYRLNVVHVKIPPLCERLEDVPALMAHFFRLFSRTHQAPAPELSAEALVMLSRYEWPGNVRELRNLAERLVVRAPARVIQPEIGRAHV
jgi:transcriptional regulator with PAS, ATPase and Fis domain